MASAARNPLIHTSIILSAIAASTYHSRQQHESTREEQEARLDEIEGTLRGHVGLIEDALDRLEGKGKGKGKGDDKNESTEKKKGGSKS